MTSLVMFILMYNEPIELIKFDTFELCQNQIEIIETKMKKVKPITFKCVKNKGNTND